MGCLHYAALRVRPSADSGGQRKLIPGYAREHLGLNSVNLMNHLQTAVLISRNNPSITFPIDNLCIILILIIKY